MRLPALVLALAGVATVVAAAPADARGDQTVVPSSATITVSGHGYGHGHGMSQWGAQGAALQGLTQEQITAFYYPGTTPGTAGGRVSVLITGDTTADVVVGAVAGLRVKSLTSGKTLPVARTKPAATSWKLKPRGAGTQVMYRTDRWRLLTTLPGDAQLSAAGQPLLLRTPTATVAYRGALRATHGDTVNVLPLEAYLRGVVPQEVPAQWQPAAVQAQAVAARTYAAYERAHVSTTRHFQLYDTTRSQVYGGAGVEQPGSDGAIEATRGRVVTYLGEPAFTQFSASNGGWTSAGTQPYLVAQQDPYDAAGGTDPHTSWSVALTDRALETRFPQVGDLTSIAVPTRDGHGDLGGRADDVVLTGTAGTATVSGEDFRFLMGLKSDWFAFTVT